MLDLLRVTVEAGIRPLRALRQVGAHFDGVLATEWNRLAASVAFGEPQEDALARLTARLPGEEVRAFAELARPGSAPRPAAQQDALGPSIAGSSRPPP